MYFPSPVLCLQMFLPLSVIVSPTTTVESSGLFSVKSELSKMVVKEDKDAQFYCEVSYFVPGMIKMRETEVITINVLCEFTEQKYHTGTILNTIAFKFNHLANAFILGKFQVRYKVNLCI